MLQLIIKVQILDFLVLENVETLNFLTVHVAGTHWSETPVFYALHRTEVASRCLRRRQPKHNNHESRLIFPANPKISALLQFICEKPISLKASDLPVSWGTLGFTSQK